MAVETGCKVAIGVVKEDGKSARYAGGFARRSGRNTPANGTKSEALEVQAPLEFAAFAQLGLCYAELFRARHGCSAMCMKGILKVFLCKICQALDIKG